ncbi:TRAP transporter, DctM subunit [Filifactor alocis ATCC 35896]|uniref:TRAP transporter, DctM subunit n=1 Tax=Filifactor alocis (strain ATCC 35896 / CCUG 47790 / D40 B5) TaxID=546269 RepID=D6GQH5_FILAD|nr:TRAP transporter large permease [Filifactor alocis]EFE29028.1 TRAP transporter, DctM subunit [Filifactor alocis ATCC 35896]
MIIFILFIILFLLIGISVPIGIALGLATTLTMLISKDVSLNFVAQNAFTSLDSFPLMAIPFFMLAGNIMSYGGVSKKLLNLADALVGKIIGGLAMVTTVTCMFFAAISGSGPATVSAIGSFMIPEMNEKGYSPGFSAAITSVSGAIGVIIPPSIPFVIYGVTSGASIGDMFIAGVIPGILIGLGLMITSYIIAKKEGFKGTKEAPPLGKAFFEAIPSLTVPVVILGGIYAGIFTPTESAAVGCVYGIFISMVFNKSMSFKDLYNALKDAVLINGATTYMVGLSSSFAFYLTIKQVPFQIGQLLGQIDNSIVVMLLMIVILLIVGLFIDNISSCIILTPIMLPIVKQFGVDPVHFGIIMTMALAIGFSTPPYGANLFVASAIGNVSVEKMIKYLKWLLLANIIVLLLVTFIPSISMGLLSLIK